MSEFTFIDKTERKYFAMIPYIITEIGLKGNEIAVYVAIKRSAGECNVCTKAKSKLAKQAGVCPKTIFNIIQKLCQVNKILKKPLITCIERLTENGDNDTNLIEIVDIWDEAIKLFQIIPGEVNITTPKVNVTGGVRYLLPEGQVTVTYKEESLNKKPSKKNIPASPPPAETVDLASFLFRAIQKTKPDCKTPNLNAWAKVIDLMMRVDNRSRLKIIGVITQLPTDPFWSGVCLSANSLRTNFDKMEIAFNQAKKPKKVSFRQKVKDYFKNNQEYNGATCYITSDAINLTRGHPRVISFLDSDFENKFKKLVYELGIEWDNDQ